MNSKRRAARTYRAGLILRRGIGVLVHLTSQVRSDSDIVFLATGNRFSATLAYSNELIEALEIRDLRILKPDARMAAEADPSCDLHLTSTDDSCRIRKTYPMQDFLWEFDAWIAGRKHMHRGSRSTLPNFKRNSAHLTINPLATYDTEAIENYFHVYNLPRHPLIARNYRSIGC